MSAGRVRGWFRVPLVELVSGCTRTGISLFETVAAVRAVKVEVEPAGRKYSELLAATGGRLNPVLCCVSASDRARLAASPQPLSALVPAALPGPATLSDAPNPDHPPGMGGRPTALPRQHYGSTTVAVPC